MKFIVILLMLAHIQVQANSKLYSLYDEHMQSLRYYEAATLLIPLLKAEPTLETSFRIGKAYSMLGTDEYKRKGMAFLNASAKRGHEGAIEFINNMMRIGKAGEKLKEHQSDGGAISRDEYAERVSEIKRYNRLGIERSELSVIAEQGTKERAQYKIFIKQPSSSLDSIFKALGDHRLDRRKLDIKTYLVVSDWSNINREKTAIMERYPELIMDMGGYQARKHEIHAFPSAIKTNGINYEYKTIQEVNQHIHSVLSAN